MDVLPLPLLRDLQGSSPPPNTPLGRAVAPPSVATRPSCAYYSAMHAIMQKLLFLGYKAKSEVKVMGEGIDVWF